MPDHKHYSKSPILESIIEIRTSRTAREIEEALADFRAKTSGEYGDEQPHLDVAVNIGPDTEMTSSRKLDGFTIRTPDNRQITGAYTNRFLFRRLAPYDCWDSFHSEARRIWVLYREVFNPESIERIGLRYVNRFGIPVGRELKDYFNLYPELAPPMPQRLDGFMIRVQIPQPQIDGISLLSSATSLGDSESVNILLDIDLVSIRAIPHDDVSLWNLLERFHDKQNEMFRACITAKTEGMIE